MAKKARKQRAKRRQQQARHESAVRLRAPSEPVAPSEPAPAPAPAELASEVETFAPAASEAAAHEALAFETPSAAAEKREEEPHEVEEEQPQEEHRASPRISVSVDIHLSSDSHFFSGLSGDISEGGLFLSTYRPLAIGSEVDLEFSLPGSEQAVHARGEVRWLREHSAHEPRGVGIAFESLSEDDRERIHRFCTMRPPLYYEDVG